MNRLHSIGSVYGETGTVQLAESPGSLIERTPLALSVPHRLFYPKHFEPRYKYPLFIWLHSPDSSEFELDELMPAVSTRNYIAIGLRGSEASRERARCYRWGALEASRRIAEELVLSAAQMATQDLSVDPSRIYLGGYGLGGTIAQWVGLRNPSSFAGIVSINGGAPDHPKLLTGWRQAKQLPVLFMYGDSSRLCDSGQVYSSIRLSFRAMLKYKYVQFNCGDCLDSAMTSMMNRFMMNDLS